MTKLAPLRKRDLPLPLPLRKLIGPSFILLGLGLGSGELILWPYLSSNYGMGLIWAAVLGITFQFFLNMEIARYTLVNGESIFVGLARSFGKFSPYWFILSTLLPWMWPGIIASSATVFAAAFRKSYSPTIAVILLLLIGMIYVVGSIIYKTQERLQKIIIGVGVPFVFILAFIFAKPTDWQELALGLIGKGKNFWFLPVGVPLATFLGAFAYAGAGGNLNLAQSYYIKEKGYGMGKFAGRITSILRGKKEDVKLEGTTFECTPENVKCFKTWWKRINIEHAIVFWATGALTMIILSLLAYTTVFGNPDVSTGINFVVLEGQVIAQKIHSFLGMAFLLMAGIMLFGTQFSVFGSTARIMSENLVIAAPKKFKIENLSKYFFFFLWLQIIAGIAIFSLGFTEPLTLVIISAVLNAFTMFIYSGMVLRLNLTNLDKQLRPSLIRVVWVGGAFAFYGIFSAITIYKNII
jgi:Mn2+/Fe2+ NRAMP family transporter